MHCQSVTAIHIASMIAATTRLAANWLTLPSPPSIFRTIGSSATPNGSPKTWTASVTRTPFTQNDFGSERSPRQWSTM